MARLRFAALVLGLGGCARMEHEASAVSWAGTLGAPACSAEQDTRNLTVLDWTAADRGVLEEKLHGGPVVVSYTGCALAIVPSCTVGSGRYTWRGYSRKDELIEVHDTDELRTRLPLGASQLVGALQHHGGLRASLALVGLWVLELDGAAQPTGDCAGATHVVVGAHAGAFALGGAARHRTDAGFRIEDGGEMSGQRTRQHLVLRGDGDASRCVGDRPDAPPPGCAALVRIELAPLPAATSSAPPPRPSPACPDEMVLVPEGEANGVRGPAFCIDRTEVTAAAWEACVMADACPNELRVPVTNGGSKRAREIAASLCTSSAHGRATHPINCVTRDEAAALCASRGAELPTDSQWTRSAIGMRGASRYPWGDAPPDGARANVCGRECSEWFSRSIGRSRRRLHDDRDGFVGTAPVGSFPAGRSDAGIDDLAGNVAEWTGGYELPNGEAVVRGGSFFDSTAAALRADDRTATDPERRDIAIGFRCVSGPG